MDRLKKLVIISALVLMQSFNYSQIIKKDGLFFRADNFKSDSMDLHADNSLSKNEQSEILIDPVIIKDDFQINTLGGDFGSDQSNVYSAMSEIGYSASVWLDERNGTRDIYAQFFDQAGNKIGSNIKVNQYPIENYRVPSIDANIKGEFVVSWVQNSLSLLAQKFNKYGQKIGNEIYVNQFSFSFFTSIGTALHSNGSFMIMWGAYSGGNYQLYSKYFDSTGTSNGSEQQINDPPNYSTSIGGGKFISVDGEGNYVICWSSGSGSNYSKIFLQRFNRWGQKLDGNIQVSQNSDSSECYFPEISTTNDGYSFIIWHIGSRYGLGNGVNARIFNFNQSFVTDEFAISEMDMWGDLFLSSTDHDSTFLLIHSSSTRPYFRRIDKYGNFSGDTVGVTYNENTARYIDLNNLSDLYQNKFFVSANVYDRDDRNVYLQEYDLNFNPVNGFKKLNDDVNSSKQRYPVVKFNQQGKSLVIWEDRRNGRQDLYGQLYDSTFTPITDNFQLNNDGIENFILKDKKITTLSDGTFIVVFIGSSDYYENKIWMQCISNTGEKIGSNILVRDNYYTYHFNVKVNSNVEDEILICYFYQYGAYLKRYDKNLNVILDEKNFIPPLTNYEYSNIDVSIDTAFNIFAASRRRDVNTNVLDNRIFGAFYDKNGIPTKPGFIIDSLNNYTGKIYCANSGKDYVFIYNNGGSCKVIREYESSNRARFVGYINSGLYYFPEIQIINFDNRKLFLAYPRYPGIAGLFFNDNKREVIKYNLFPLVYTIFDYEDNLAPYFLDLQNNKLFNVFEANNNLGTNIDIWGNVKSLPEINFSDEMFYQPVHSDFLYNNFPNPFNTTTKIAYEILAFHHVKLAVYDILGREIKVLINENQEKGIYELEFDAAGLASGVYFLKLEAFNTTIKKMIVLK